MLRLKINLYLLLFLLNYSSYLYLSLKPWTYLTYIAADNNLANVVSSDIQEMKNGANNNVNVLAYANLKINGQKVSKKLIITKNNVSQIGQEFNLDSGIPSTFIKSLTWAIIDSPSNFLAIDLWNHGSGVLNPARQKRGICFDDSTGNYLNDKDLQYALAQAVKLRGGKKVNVLAFDACLMASLECNVTWSDYVDFIVASEETIPAQGYRYDLVLNFLAQNPNNPKAFAISIVNSYKQTYQGNESDYTLSAVDASKMKALAFNVNNLAKSLTALLQDDADKTFFRTIQQSLKNTLFFSISSYIDLYDFYVNLLNNFSKLKNIKKQKNVNFIMNILNNGILIINQSVINNVTSNLNKKAKGISIYFPRFENIDASYPKLDWSMKYPNWLAFLRKYISLKS